MDIRFGKTTGILLVADIASTYLCYWFASVLTRIYDQVFNNTEIFFIIGIIALINVVVLAIFRLYNNLWEYASVDELIQIVLAIFIATLVSAVLLWLAKVRLPIREFVGSGILLIFFIGGTRLLWRINRSKKHRFKRGQDDRPRTLVVGAGETGALTIDRMLSRVPSMPGVPVALADDDPLKKGKRIHGVKVAGTTEDIPSLVEKFNVSQIVVAIPSVSGQRKKRIYELCTSTECTLKTLPDIRDINIDDIGEVSFRDVDVGDLLGREEIVLDTRIASSYVKGRTILVTGGGGSIGSELCRQLSSVDPARIVVFDMYENDAYMLKNELQKKHPNIDVVVEIGSVCDEQRVDELFAMYKPAAVFHAAAHKHVPLMELAPREAIANNVFGTLNVVRAADRHGVSRFIFISTDKAVNPTSVMGATKRMGEMIMQHYAQTSKTIFTAVRFGNVLGSNGSVIPLFKNQIAAGGPVTVTHPEIERYFMTIPEASRLVIQAGGMARGGEIFILDMGEPVKIMDLAKNLIRLSGLKLGEDIQIEITGLRDGEKLYEELLMDEENTVPTGNSSILVSVGQEITYGQVSQKLEALESSLSGTDDSAIAVLEDAVPTYRHTVNVQ